MVSPFALASFLYSFAVSGGTDNVITTLCLDGIIATSFVVLLCITISDGVGACQSVRTPKLVSQQDGKSVSYRVL